MQCEWIKKQSHSLQKRGGSAFISTVYHETKFAMNVRFIFRMKPDSTWKELAALQAMLALVLVALRAEMLPDFLWSNTRGRQIVDRDSVCSHVLCRSGNHGCGTYLDLVAEESFRHVVARLVRSDNRTRVAWYQWAYKSAGSWPHPWDQPVPCIDSSNTADIAREFFESSVLTAGTIHDRAKCGIFLRKPILRANYNFDRRHRRRTDLNSREDSYKHIHRRERGIRLAGFRRLPLQRLRL